MPQRGRRDTCGAWTRRLDRMASRTEAARPQQAGAIRAGPDGVLRHQPVLPTGAGAGRVDSTARSHVLLEAVALGAHQNPPPAGPGREPEDGDPARGQQQELVAHGTHPGAAVGADTEGPSAVMGVEVAMAATGRDRASPGALRAAGSDGPPRSLCAIRSHSRHDGYASGRPVQRQSASNARLIAVSERLSSARSGHLVKPLTAGWRKRPSLRRRPQGNRCANAGLHTGSVGRQPTIELPFRACWNSTSPAMRTVTLPVRRAAASSGCALR